ncbi:hypothetical protein [Ruegeria halocynthiae]|uniref:hypothetical protein n=1 Tax=Ruegeria halocynthiae TaxID=985054 RepID=UPI00055C611E|nr:hypothetical protein [Ruegeria halocynthiae]
MMFRRTALAAILATLPLQALAQTADTAPKGLHLELNKVQDVEGACRLTFLAENETGAAIETASFETVIFDATGRVVNLTLFKFRDLPASRPRVRQFDVKGMTCDMVGRVLINGVNSCIVEGSDSEVCDQGLSLSSRTEVELIG